MARLYTNENFPQQVVERLRAFGHNVETSHDAGHSGVATPDAQVLDYAVRAERIVVTLNRRHFVVLHSARPEHFGIVVCTFDADFDGQARRIHTALSAAGDCKGTLIQVNRS